jgi:hypothetical protein
MNRLLIIAAVALSFTACQCTGPTSDESGARAPEGTMQPDRAIPPDKAPTGAVEPVQLAPVNQGAGYTFAGPYGLQGALDYDGQQWQLTGAFEFPTAGYTVGELEVTVLKKLPEEAHISVPVQPPPLDAMVAQVITTVPIEWSGALHKDATFKLMVERVPPQGGVDEPGPRS